MNNNFDLEERTGKFGEEIIKFCKSIKQDIITNEKFDKNLNLVG